MKSSFDTAYKTCFKCGQWKPLDAFYPHKQMADGHLNKCKECAKADVRRDYYHDVEESRRRNRRRYYDNPASRGRSTRDTSAAKSGWIARNPDKRKAHIATNNAIRGGLIQPQPCEVCGSSERIHAHHDDYSKPFAVRWLCPKHHGEIHRKGA